MIEGPDEWAVFMDPSVFGEPVTYTPSGGIAQSLAAVFTAAHATTLDTSTVAPVLALFPPAGLLPAAGDGVALRGISYRVADVQPDGTGLTRLILERV